MKRKTLIALALLMPMLSLAQERFYNLYEGLAIKQFFLINSQYVSFGVESHPETSAMIPMFNTIELNGVQTESFSYSDTTDGYTFNGNRPCILIGDTLFISGSSVHYYKAYDLNRIVMKYNIMTREIHNIISYTECWPGQGFNYLIDTIESGMIITSDYTYTIYNSFPMFIFTNWLGDTISVKKFLFLPTDAVKRRVYPRQTLCLPDGGFLLSCQDEIGYDSGKVRSWFLRIDSQGNELWRKASSTQDTLCYNPFAFIMPDGNFLITWSDPFLYNSSTPYAPILNSARTLWFATMSNTGIISNRRKITDDYFDAGIQSFYVNDFSQDTAGNIFLTGTAIKYNEHGFLLKINPQGEVVWYRDFICFPENEAGYEYTKFNSITPTPDGGFIMGGEYCSSASSMFPDGVQKGLAVKVDACGCLEEDCNPDCYNGYSTQTIKAMQAAVYPNPVRDVVTVSLPVKGSTARIELFDATGCQWVDVARECSETTTGSQVKLNVAGLPTGVYVLNVWVGGKLCTGKVAVE